MTAIGKVTSKGQVTIPGVIRDQFQIAAGDELVFFALPGGDLAVRVRRPKVGSGRGAMAKYASGLSLDALSDAVGEAVAGGVADKAGPPEEASADAA